MAEILDEITAERDRLRDALELITHIHHRKDVHLGPHRASGLEKGCIACIAQVAKHGDGFHGVDVEEAGRLIQAALHKAVTKSMLRAGPARLS